MDIHRCRFVPYPPSTINALAFSHSHIEGNQKTAPPRLAVGRANGDIEIWNPLNGAWLQETIIRGGKDRSIDALVWTQNPNEEDPNGRQIIGKSRLFSVGFSTTVTEWDLEKARPLRQAGGNHGDIWCLAVQPPVQTSKKEANGTSTGLWDGQNIITGCTDGSLVLYSTKDDDLQLQKVVVRISTKKAKIVSVAFQDRNVVIAGCNDSMIRIRDIRNGKNVANMSIGNVQKGGPKDIVVWAIKVLQNGNIVSGDSTGEVKIWDGRTYTLLQRIQGHRSDIFSLITSFDGSMIFSGGMDRRTVAYKQIGNGKGRWAEIGHRRYHKHDVKAMASLEFRGMSVVVSGGPDASPIILPLKQFGMENQRTLPYLSQEPALRSSMHRRLMLSFWDREVHVWRFRKTSRPVSDLEELEGEPAAKNKKLVAKILIKGEANITSASLSADGDALAVSTVTDIKVFQLQARKSDEGDGLRITKLDVPSSFSFGARLVQFSPDRKWLCVVRPDSRVFLARSTSASSITFHPVLTKLERINRRIEKYITLGGLGIYDRTITQIEFSADSRILAVSDLAGYIDTFVLSGQEDLTNNLPSTTRSDDASASSSSDLDSEFESDSEGERPQQIFGQHWTRNPSASSIPKLPSAPTILSFRPATSPLTNGVTTHAIPTRHNPNPVSHDLPTGEDRLLVVTATSEVFEFEVLKGSLSPWSRRNPTGSFPEDFRKVRDLAKGCIWDVKGGRERVWIYGAGWLSMFDLSRDFPDPPNAVSNGVNGNAKSKKRKRHGKEVASGAGSAIPDSILGTGISRKMQRIIHEEVDETSEIPFHEPDAMDIDSDSDASQALSRFHRPSENVAEESDKLNHWQTFKYRPILGICTIGEDSQIGPEVAIVERPIWETDLGPRYFGDQEWEKSGV